VQNFGQVASKKGSLKIIDTRDQEDIEVGTAKILVLKPYQKTIIELTCGKLFKKEIAYDFAVIINPHEKKPVALHGKVTPVKECNLFAR
jgi:hypothetical protein